uniref:NADH-ubiquinone oxidoreductase chain 3 n=1 Tax=Antigona lamellaris TaxID=345433 RepID=A0A866UBM7_9BIVA|nr:NADH dehydrogenase subunit 3 [Antigona lamellaris]
MEMYYGVAGVLSSSSFSVIYLTFIFGLSVLLMLIVILAGQKWRFEWAKLSAFECGFDSMSSTRSPFSLRFFLLALLFLVFDVEVVLLFPYVFSMMIFCSHMLVFSKLMYFCLLMILLLGLIHELNEGTLDWEFD